MTAIRRPSTHPSKRKSLVAMNIDEDIERQIGVDIVTIMYD